MFMWWNDVLTRRSWKYGNYCEHEHLKAKGFARYTSDVCVNYCVSERLWQIQTPSIM